MKPKIGQLLKFNDKNVIYFYLSDIDFFTIKIFKNKEKFAVFLDIAEDRSGWWKILNFNPKTKQIQISICNSSNFKKVK